MSKQKSYSNQPKGTKSLVISFSYSREHMSNSNTSIFHQEKLESNYKNNKAKHQKMDLSNTFPFFHLPKKTISMTTLDPVIYVGIQFRNALNICQPRLLLTKL